MNPEKTYVHCPLCSKTVPRNQDGRIRSHQGYIPQRATTGGCGSFRISTVGWPTHTDEQGRTVHYRPGDVPGRKVSPHELLESAFGPQFQVDPSTLAMLSRRFDIHLKENGQ